ncbi:MAG: FAD-dependent oxidoreductase [Candidatus Aminicenantes bacterium]|nr:FAD-dependent oxidoreductase [Candidatus Aminicenantes bacterium]
MAEYRIHKHPILTVEPSEEIEIRWKGRPLKAKKGEMISSALFANGIRIFGHHPKDGAPQGMFCANGQCAQCLVIANGKPEKACMTQVAPGMNIEPLDSLPNLPQEKGAIQTHQIRTIEVSVLIIGGGPAGMSAAIKLMEYGVKTLLVDDKHRLGGKLVLQTHRFFGSVDAVYAGTRGIDIATKLEEKIRQNDCVDIWLNSTALAVFSDHKVGILKDGKEYVLIKPKVLLIATGAREKSLVFKGNTLPGVYGAGAFQTLVNRDLVEAAERLFIIGGGNVGLIAGYHALQAGIKVVGLAEAMPECGGYKVHRDKLARMGVPIYTSHSVVSANGDNQVESITIAQVDSDFNPIPGTEKSFSCDTILIAVGLDSVDEFYHKAKEYGMKVFASGDAEEIAEASSAMFYGKIKGMEIAQALGIAVGEIPQEWYHTADILKSNPGKTYKKSDVLSEEKVFPVLHCFQEIPCDPCIAVCPNQLITIPPDDIRKVPEYIGPHNGKGCIGCERCVVICPGLAVTLVDYRKDPDWPTVTIAYEFLKDNINIGDRVYAMDDEGATLGEVEVTGVRAIKANDRTILVKLKSPKEYARRIAGIRIQPPVITKAMDEKILRIEDDIIICRCERVTAGQIRDLIKKGCHDMNEIKAVTRAGMGACGGKTCSPIILRIFAEEGISLEKVVENVKRPLIMEVPLGVFAGKRSKDNE